MEHEDDRELRRRVAGSYARVGPVDDEAKGRLMDRLRREDAPGASGVSGGTAARDAGSNSGERGLLAWRPLTAGLAVAASLALGTALGWTLHSRLGSAPKAALSSEIAEVPSTREVRLVQFVLAAPKASHVTVVGDFNEWDPIATPMARRVDGAWTAAIPVSPGRHVYAFIVDGDRWVSDPAAPMAPEDGFGIRNSVIVVGGQEPT
ncbi:MAG: hypothetical protein E6K80_12555 [Candidatus Eisenbacteria bacterium]|uniref:Glycoside hydrolase family 13 N-terminal domain-containing protein n=1 Tax=Eiseniibacteriota bacterium TaxID=2212470 RepID=A0A538TZU0_UNCEI|nr:MAG: hypothetical protein E6K80_12555 [Candidatus Eisenbacteria bacterium]